MATFGHRCVERYVPQVNVSIDFTIYPRGDVEKQLSALFCDWHDGQISMKDLLGKAETNPLVDFRVKQTPRFVSLPTLGCVCPPRPEESEND